MTTGTKFVLITGIALVATWLIARRYTPDPMPLFAKKVVPKTFASLGGALEIELTSDWKQAEEDGAREIYKKDPRAGVLRISVLTFESEAPLDASVPPPSMEQLAERAGSQIEPYPSGGFQIVFVTSDESTRMHCWQIAHFVGTRQFDIANISFAVGIEDTELLSNVADLAMIERQVMNLHWNE